MQDKNEILYPLRVVRESLNSKRGQHIANSDLLDLIRRVRCFGINLARIDIRQESSRHEKLLIDLIKKKFKIDLSTPTILITFQPETVNFENNKKYISIYNRTTKVYW